MKETLTTSEIARRLLADENAAWSRGGAYALAKYLEELEEDANTELEFDRVGIRCDFSEHETAIDAASQYDWKSDEDDDEDAREASALHYLQGRTEVIEFADGVIIRNF
jgi:hypothetical protein